MLTKKLLRQDYRRVLANLDRRWIAAASHRVSNNLQELLTESLNQEVRHILAFVSFFPGEVDLSQFISEVIGQREVYLPLSYPDGRMTFISVGSDWRDMAQTGELGIPEPDSTTGARYDESNASTTAILVPGLAFDRDGNRLGRGKGYYDRFLALNKNKSMVKIGVGWEMQLIEKVPAAAHDIMMDWYCHERGCLSTGVLFDEDDE